MTAGKGGAGTYLQKSIALHIIPFMHEPASVARNSFPQVLHGAAGQSMQTCDAYMLTVYYDGVHKRYSIKLTDELSDPIVAWVWRSVR